jgi:hypothetical protein
VGAGTSEGVQIEQDFHEMVIHWHRASLDEKDVLIANDLIYSHICLRIVKDARGGFTKRNAEDVGDFMRQGRMG